MGRQIIFKMSIRDESVFLKDLARMGECIIARRTGAERLNAIQRPAVQATSRTPNRSVHLVIIPGTINAKVVVSHVAGSSCYVIDTQQSEVCEWTRSRLVDGEHESEARGQSRPWFETGRIWYTPIDLDGVPKRKCFVRWADQVIRKLRSRCTSMRHGQGIWVGGNVAELWRDGRISLDRV